MTHFKLFNRFIVVSLFICFFSWLVPAFAQTAVTQPDTSSNFLMTGPGSRVVLTDIQHDVSPPLRELAKGAMIEKIEPREAEELRQIPLVQGFKPAEQPDAVLQQTSAPGPTLLAPSVGLNFDGIGQGVFGFSVQFAPPDTNGAVGLTQYVQWVNVNFAVFDKTTGNILPNFPVLANTLWKNFKGPCETNNDGDPIVTYDKQNDRWIFGQFAVRAASGFLTNSLQCIAVSTSSDATGSYNRYAFQYNNAINDYPKMAVWPDAYYATFNLFDPVTLGFLGADACAFDGAAMRNGQTATQVCFRQGPSVGGLLPSDVDGHTQPSAGEPNFVMDFGANSLNLYKFHVDFATPGNSTFTGPTNIPVTAFTPLCNGFGSCVPQLNTTTLLDSLADRLMYRLAYRNFGDHESLVVNHSVAVGGTANSGSGVRWYEIQNPNGTPTVVQQSTYAPDSNFRWMGSIAMDQSGNLVLGYSESSSNMFPSIAIAGQEIRDPRSTLQAETSIVSGTGSQTVNVFGTPLTRWGDYSAMQVDPVDDCTFWYTTEYLKTTGVFDWNTRIANFKFPACNAVELSVTSTHTGNFTQGDTGKTYSITVQNIGDNATNGTVTVTDTLPTGLTATAISGPGWSCTLGTLICTRTDALSGGNSYPAITLTVSVASNAPGIVTNTVTATGGGNQDTVDNTANDSTTVIQLGPDPAITKSHSGTFEEGKTGTYTIAVKNTGLTDTDGTTVTVSDPLPTGFTVNAVSGTGWDCSASTSTAASCKRSDVLVKGTSYPAITLTVNVANDAPAVITNTATVSGGGDTNTFNNSSSDKTNVTLHPDLTITKAHTGDFHQGQGNATYTLTVSNIGLGATSGTVTVTDTLPTAFTFGVANGFPWSCSTNFGTVTCTRNDALAGKHSFEPITMSVSVANDAPASVTNTATVSGGGEINTSNDTATDPTTIDPSPDLTIAKSHAPDPFIVGSTGTYTLTVSNTGHASTSGTVNVLDALPQGLTATANSGSGWTCGPVLTSAVSCFRSDALAAGISYPAILVTVSVNGGGPQVTNQASVSDGGEFNTNNDTASDVTNVIAPVLSITKTHTGNFTVGQSGTYTITVTNVGSVSTVPTIVTVGDSIPNGMTPTSAVGIGWSCSGVGNSFGVFCTRSDVLAAGASYPPISLTMSVGGVIQSSVTNFVNVGGGGDLNTHGASDPTTINLPDLQISKSHIGNFSVGQQGATYTINVSNVGTIATAGGPLTVSDVVPSGLQASNASGTGWSCTLFSGFDVQCTRDAGTLAPGSSYPPITITFNVLPNAAPSITNTAQMSGIGFANPSHTSASDVTTITGFGINPFLNTASVNAGSSTGFLLGVNLASNAGTVTFSASGLPANSKATFNPSSTSLSATVTMTVDTSGNGHTAALQPPVGFNKLNIYLGCVVSALALCGIGARRRGKLRIFWLATSISVLGFVLLLIGCGGGGGTPPPPPPPPPVTPSGTYTITITGASSTTGVPSVNVPVTLIVR